ncbi:MAG: hypothetical protein ACTHZI_07740, partial [Luteimonas sp.]
MRRWLLRIGVALLALMVMLVALWGASRLLGPTAEQRRAVEVFEQLPPPQGSNAFPALWLLQWDVPEAEQAALVAEDVARFRALPPQGDEARPAARQALGRAVEGRYPDLAATLAEDPPSCTWREAGCLERVRSDRDAHAMRLGQAARLVDRVDAVTGHDHYRNPFPRTMDMLPGLLLLPELQLMGLGMTRQALLFVDGDIDGALAGTCRALAGWRRLAGNSDSLLLAMHSAAGIQGYGSLLADMLAQVPLDHPLPATCEAALAPVQAGELGLCPAMRGEWEFGQMVLDLAEPPRNPPERLLQSLIFDREATNALAAWNMAWSCSKEAVASVVEDVPLRLTRRDRGFWRFECVANAGGCLLMSADLTGYVEKGLRMQDTRAQIRLLRTLEWMR